MNRSISIVAGVLFLCLSAKASVTVIENTPSRLVFRWELPKFDSISTKDSGKYVTRLGFRDENIALGSAGEPVVPGHSVYVGIPVSGTVGVTFSADRIQTIRLKHALRKYPFKGDGRFSKKQVLQFTDEWVSEPNYTWFKTMRAAQVVIRPFLPAGDGQTIRVLRSGVCTITFPAAAAAGIKRKAATPYQKMQKKLLLNYDVASGWVSPSKSAGMTNAASAPAGPVAKTLAGTVSVKAGVQGTPVAKAIDPYPLTYGDPTLRTFTIGDGHTGQNEMTTNENGIIMITGAQILHLWGAQAGQIGMGQVALYASTKGALPTGIPGAGAIPAGVQEIPLFRCDRNGNGVVDSGDYFLAWVTGLNDWAYDSSSQTFGYVVDNYDDNRHYWLSLKSVGDGASMQNFVQPAGSGDTVDYFTNHASFGQPQFTLQDVTGNAPAEAAEVGYSWAQITQNNPTWNYVLTLPGVDTTVGGLLRITAFTESIAAVTVSLGGVSLCQNFQSGQTYPVGRWGNANLQVQYADNNGVWFQLISAQADYRRPLRATSDTVHMQVFSACTTAVLQYRFSGASGQTFVFRIPQNESTVSLIDTFPSGAPVVWSDSGNTGARYFVCNAAGFFTFPNTDSCFAAPPARLSSTHALPDLRSIGNQATYLIVTHPAFLAQAENLAVHKAQMGFKPGIVSINDIYTDFSGGNTDPVAIRNFLAFATRNWAMSDSLDYVVLLGDGDYDYKQIAYSEVDFIPPAELNEAEEDEFYANLTPGGGQQSVALGRIPCQTTSQAQTVVDKIIAVEDTQKADWSSWRNSALFVNDDDMQLQYPDPIGFGHQENSDATADVAKACRPSLAVERVSEFEYPTNASYEKPECASALVNVINNGVGYVCFYGHGNPFVWTDEHILTTSNYQQLSNTNQYPFFTEFSCCEGQFDLPNVTTLSQDLLEMPGAGAIATLASSREASSDANKDLGVSLYSYLLDTLSEMPIGMAMVAAKAEANAAYPDDASNTSLYSLFGDPSITIVPPSHRMQLAVTDTSGTVHDTLQALEPIEITGQILDSNGNPDAQIGTNAPAFVHLGLFNPNYMTGRTDGGADTSLRFWLPGTPVFSGTTAIVNGKFKQTAMLPRSLTFDTDSAQLLGYVWQGSTTGVAFNNTLYFHGTASSSALSKDSVGPQISVRPIYDAASMQTNSVSFTGGRIESSLPLQIQILLSSPNGINVIGTGPDEGLTMAIPGVQNQCNINSKFQFAAGDYRKGSAIIGFESGALNPGAYPVAITAQDLLGNISHLTFTMQVDDSFSLNLASVMNIPNPMRMGQSTRFFFFPNKTTTQNTAPPATASYTIKIYSMSGKLLKVIQNAQNGETWDGRDQTGYVLPPDVYLYQIAGAYQNIYTSGGLSGSANAKSAIQKLVIYPPR
jgi:hypothetical protein